MCLGVPGQIQSKFEKDGLSMAWVDFDGLQKEICIEHVKDVQVGHYVLVHVGFALSQLSPTQAKEIDSLWEQLCRDNFEKKA